ncbi:hypothetical protein ACJMK2_029019 [Sinanodonta woodiana]|uniref:Uncharacterized protein n=1 Tax=Sinanodonta woodiana TaxID=1069815 RepID=A0ABD3XAQ3_SINWO
MVLSNNHWPPFQNHEGQTVNISKLISVAKSTLGVDSFCNASKERKYERLSYVCVCDNNCAHFQKCCPDNPYAYLKQSCLNIALYQSERSYKVARTMVDACPYHENHTLPICRTRVTRSIFDVPVLSNKTLLAYVHRLCALCSLEKDNDLQPWEPVLAKCVSSHSEMAGDQMNTTVLKRLLSEGECVLVYNDLIPNFYNCIPSILRVPGIVDSCNVTGMWERYDPDIDWACKHYTSQFEQFANVFCYICNPDIVSHNSGPLIDTCNISGYWAQNDITIEQGCLQDNSLPRFHPFKNAFCYICNMFDGSFRGVVSTHRLQPIQTNSINVYVVETYDQETSEFLTEIHLVEIKVVESEYSQYLPNKAVEEFKYECNQRCLSNYKNTSNDYYVCTECQCNTMKVCEKSHEGKEIFYCVPDTFKTNYRQHNFHLVLGVCLSPNVSNEIKQKCEEPDPDNILDNIPVILTNDVMFKNRYCSKCNGYDDIRFLDVEISCGVYIDARLTQSFENLIQLSLQNSCEIKYVRNNCNDLNLTPLSTQSIAKCNTTGYWEVEGESQDIVYACEQDLSGVSEKFLMRSLPTLDKPFQEFKNIYCYVCNPYNSYPLYTKCNMSEQWETYDAQVETDCTNGPRESKWGPFKNFDCFKCNDKRDASNEVYFLKDLIGILVHESYRYVFEVTSHIFDELARTYADPMEFHQTSKETLVSSQLITL